MNPQTVQLLNQLNTQFYQTVASSFDETRARPWSGWLELLNYLPPPLSSPASGGGLGGGFRVLDVGCGNGRFGAFLAEQRLIEFTGIDSNAYLLQRAGELLTEKNIPHQLYQHDILAPLPVKSAFDLVVLFGVMHHIPGEENRRAMLLQLLELVAPGGLLVVTFWLFYKVDKLRERILPWDDPRLPAEYQNLDVESNDFILDWRRDTPALRYCHYVDRAEADRLTEGMQVIGMYEADAANQYVVIKKI